MDTTTSCRRHYTSTVGVVKLFTSPFFIKGMLMRGVPPTCSPAHLLSVTLFVKIFGYGCAQARLVIFQNSAETPYPVSSFGGRAAEVRCLVVSFPLFGLLCHPYFGLTNSRLCRTLLGKTVMSIDV